MKEASATISIPRWYQDLSIPQMQNVLSLGDIMRADYAERVTGRTQRALGDIGVTSTFVKITPKEIKQSSRLTDLDPVKFLCEIYRIVTGKYFTDEEYKKAYDCNERIILSAIAFLTLPETVIELHRRLPAVVYPKFPPKPLPPTIGPRIRAASPYLEPLFEKPDWLTYKKELYLWRKKIEETPIPRVILPLFSIYSRFNEDTTSIADSDDVDEEEKDVDSYRHENIDNDNDNYGRQNATLDNSPDRVDKSTKGEGESGQRHETNSHSKGPNSNDDKIEETNKLSRVKVESVQQNGPNLISQRDKQNHDKISEKNQLSRAKVESVQQHGPNLNSQREKKNHDKIKEKKKLSRAKAESVQQHGQNLISPQEKKNPNKIGEKNKLSVERKESRKLSRRNFISQKNEKIHKNIGERNKLPKGQRKSDRPHGSNLPPQQQNQAQGKISDENLENNENQRYQKQAGFDKKNYHDGKETHLIVTGVTENDGLTNFPISHETSGIACLTPYNSDESFFRVLNLDEAKKKSYPRGRENLSRKWQEWFRDIDEEFIKVEKEANKIIKSIEGTLKIMGPETVCDSCCSCRQTRKANVKYHKTKTPQLVIDSITMDGELNKYVVGSLVMNSPAPSPSDSIADMPEIIDSHDNIIKNKIISGVTNEMGEMNYCITGVSKEVEHVPRKIVDNSSLGRTIKNVPPCGCAIEKMINEGLTVITSDDNIPWTREQQICIGKKYRPQDIGANSCRDYPYDRTCKRNPFKGKIDEQIRAKLRERENFGKDNYPPEKKNMYSMAEFRPCGDEDGMAICGGPWGAVNIPDEEEIARKKAEAKIIRESPPCGDKPGRSICGGPFGSRHPIPKKPKKTDDDDDEEEPEDDEPEEKTKRIREPRQKSIVTKIEKSLNRDDHCSTIAEKNGRIGNFSETTVGPESKIKQYGTIKSNRMDKKRKSSKDNDKDSKSEHRRKSKSKTENLSLNEMKPSTILEKKHDDEETRRMKNETKRIMKEWNRMKIMANKFVVSPISIPEDPSTGCKRETKPDCRQDEEIPSDDETKKEGPFGRRTESEQALPAIKTLLYLTEPNEPMETIAVRPGGKPCKCRENRNAKKILLYNVAGITSDGRGGTKRNGDISRVIDGLIYITPIPSVRNSEEYVVEYELYESPYERCSRERENDNLRYIERYLGPKSLMRKQPRGLMGCKCSSVRENIVDTTGQAGTRDNERESIMPNKGAKPEEKKFSEVCVDEGLMEFYARCRDNIPCWLRCVEFSKDGCCSNPRKLQVKRPVCECKYERKILKREEEKKKWLGRQERLRSYKKQPYTQVEGLSRPMETDTNLIISDIKRISRQNESENDNLQYSVAGITENRVMTTGDCILSGIGMYTPVITPEPSKSDLPIANEHRQWSTIDNRGPKDISGNAEITQAGQSSETNWREKIRDKTDKRVDVLFQNDRVNRLGSGSKKLDATVDRHKSVEKGVRRSGGKGDIYHSEGRKSDTRVNRGKSVEKDVRHSGEKGDIYNSKERKSDAPVDRDKSVGKDVRSNRGKDDIYHSGGSDDTSRNRAKDDTHRSKAKDDTRKSEAKDDKHRSRAKDDTHRSSKKDDTHRSSKKDAKLQNVQSVNPMQKSHEDMSAGATGTDSEKISPERDIGQGNKTEPHTTKSTGSIVSPDKRTVSQSTKKESSVKYDLNHLMQIELENMANEGFLFAKLPDCHQMPQLQYWIMYRKGIALPPEEKKNLMNHSMKIWKSLEKQNTKKIKAPPLKIPKEIMKNLNWEKADEVKREAAMNRVLFYSNLRKSRVLQSREMWGLMEFGKFPGVSFKKAFFTYQASKESDGFVFKPWENLKNSEES